MEKYIKTTDDMMASEHNIAYTNKRCSYVSDMIRKNLGKKNKYEVGEHMICRKYKKEGGTTFHVNFKYQIKSIGAEGVVLQNIKPISYITPVYLHQMSILDMLTAPHAIRLKAPRLINLSLYTSGRSNT